MAKFNTKTSNKPNDTSYEGGLVYTKSPVEQWLNFLFSSYIEDRFYESAQNQLQTFYNLTEDMIKEYGAEFVAKCAIFARNELGMRSAAQFVAGYLNDYQFDNKRTFYRNFCHRPDDVAEIFGVLNSFTPQRKRSHAMVRGFGDYISSLSPYTLGKYKLNNHTYNMYDIINITHAHSDAIDAYKKGTLASPDTWEVAISGAEDKEHRDKEWIRLVEENKLGYLALIRNLNNILDSGVFTSWIKQYLYPQLINKDAIHKSMVFPYQIYSAYKNISIRNSLVILGLEEAFRIAIDNLPTLEGDTAIVLDVSGSMSFSISAKSNITIREVGAVYAACIALKTEHCQIIKFATSAKEFKFNKLDNIFKQISEMDNEDGCGWGTNLAPAYNLLHRSYDRIMLISDMQIMDGRDYWYCYAKEDVSPSTAFKNYCKRYGQTKLYSFDLGNYRTQTDNPNNPNIYLCTSLSEKTLKFISLLESGQNLINYINENYDYR